MLTQGVRNRADVAAVASRTARSLSILVWHYHDDDLPGLDAAVELTVSGLDKELTSSTLAHYRIDERHSNAYAEWKRLGSPITPDQNLYARLETAGKLAQLGPPSELPVERGASRIKFDLPRQGVSLLELTW